MFPYLAGLHKAHFSLFKLFLYLLFHVVLVTSCFAATNNTLQVSQCCVLMAFTSLQGNQPGPCKRQTIKDQCSLLSTNSNPPHHSPPWGSVPLSVLTQILLATSFFFFFFDFQKDHKSFPYVLKCPVRGRCFQLWRSYQRSPLQQMFSVLVSFIQYINVVPAGSQVLC